MNGQRCGAKVYAGAWARASVCNKPAKVERDGKWYCGIHNPDRVHPSQVRAALAYAVKSAQWDLEKCERIALHQFLELNPDSPITSVVNKARAVVKAAKEREAQAYERIVPVAE